jgi:Ca-activated chloride channel family protein
MNRKHVKSLIVVGVLIVATGVAMGSLNGNMPFGNPVPSRDPVEIVSTGDGPLMLSGHLVQDKIFSGGDGTVSLSLTMQADEVFAPDQTETQHVDMVIVLDQSGSMQGQKIEYARQAVLNLLSGLSEKDRFALIGYANSVRKYSELTPVTETNREKFQSLIYNLSSGGNTNLGGGLQEGINTLLATPRNGNVEKVILISDGLANRGIIHPEALGNIASIAVEEEFAVSTVGVGNEFNEQLMTTIADRGAGNYYYLANPQTFAEVFQQEFQYAKTVAAQAIEIGIPLPDGVSLIKASGYPITIKDNHAIINPGELLSGQTRKLFLTLKVPTHSEATYELGGINVRYLHQGSSYTASLSEPFRIACVSNPEEAVASIVSSEWEEKVLQEDFNDLRERISVDLKNGDQEGAMDKIDQYYREQESLNAEVGSSKVTTNLNEELDELRGFVRQTFSGSPQQVEEQQKANAKDLQYQGYKERRAKK